MTTPLFITGTDTDVGKTYVTVRLLQWLQQQGLTASGVKPIASGAERTPQGLRNADALALQQASAKQRAYAWHNPVVFEPAIAPHIASQQLGQTLQAEALYHLLRSYQTDSDERLLVEGAGGWLLPLNNHETFSQVIAKLQWPTLMVVGMRLGCLNHALLTWQAMQQQQISCLGWIANDMTGEMPYKAENLATLAAHLGEPLAVFSHNGAVPAQHQLHKILT